MNKNNTPEIVVCSWNERQAELRAIRETVFINEQKVPIELEWDNEDTSATHLLAVSYGKPIGTARLLSTGQIGRMAVIKDFRKQGIATQLLKRAELEALKQSLNPVFLHAQTYIRHFYASQGYLPRGDQFMDAGIPHIEMVKYL